MRRRLLAALLAPLSLPVQTAAAEWRGLVDVRAVQGDDAEAWPYGGLGKQRWDDGHDGLRLGQAVLEARGQLLDTVTGTVVLNGYEDREGFADLSEAFLQWKPLPGGAWRTRVKAGAFFPKLSLENDGPGWTPGHMLSASAINTWIGEELRALGAELELSRPGKFLDSPHDFAAQLAVYGWNDPAGGLLAWRGFAVGDRITGLSERLPFADLPVYRADGALALQADWIEPFHEIDDKLGYYLGGQYRYAGWLELSALHYDNRGDPRDFRDGQYAWHTEFEHLGLRVEPAEGWRFQAQYLNGSTTMGRAIDHSVDIDYRSWYLMASYERGPHRISLRRDDFRIEDRDLTPQDRNDEDGDAWALAYLYRLGEGLVVGGEWLRQDSERRGRFYLGLPVAETETSVQLVLRWGF